MNLPDDATPARPKPPRHGLLVIGLILIAMALLAVYSNVQNGRRDQIEKVTIAPAPSASVPANTPAAATP